MAKQTSYSKLDAEQIPNKTYDETNDAVRVNIVAGGGGGGGDASASNQQLQITQETLTNTALGTPADSPATTDTGTFSIIAFIKRGMQNWTTLLAKIPALVSGRIPVDGSGVTQPVSAASLPLPTGASTEATLSSLNGKVTAVNTGAVTVVASALPSGAATSAKQAAPGTAGSPSADVLTVQGTTSMTALKVDGSSVIQPIAIPVDISPATQNITVVDSGSTVTPGMNSQSIITGTPTAGSVATFNFSAIETVRVQVSGTWTGTLQSELSFDGGTTYYMVGLHQSGSTFSVASFTANLGGIANLAGATNYRVRATAAVTGTAIIKVVESINEAVTYVANAQKLVDGTGTSSQLAITAGNAAKVDGSAVTQPVTMTKGSAANAASVAVTTATDDPNLGPSILATLTNASLSSPGTFISELDVSAYSGAVLTVSGNGSGFSVNTSAGNLSGALIGLQGQSLGQISSAAPTSSTTSNQNLYLPLNGIGLLTITLGSIASGTVTCTLRLCKRAGFVASLPATVTPIPIVSQGPGSTFRAQNAATTGSPTNAKASAAILVSLMVVNANATTDLYFQVYNLTTTPVIGTSTPVLTFRVKASSTFVFDVGPFGYRLTAGLGYAFTSDFAGATGVTTAADMTVCGIYS